VLRREDRVAWALASVGLLLWSGGGFVWGISLNDLANPPPPPIAGPPYPPLYPAPYSAGSLLVRAHVCPPRGARWVWGVGVGRGRDVAGRGGGRADAGGDRRGADLSRDPRGEPRRHGRDCGQPRVCAR